MARIPTEDPIGDILADGMRRLRGSATTQDAVADAARLYGLAWRRNTVAAIETGRRRLTITEALLLGSIMREATGKPFVLGDLFPPEVAMVGVGDHAEYTAECFRSALPDGLVDRPEYAADDEAVWWTTQPGFQTMVLSRIPEHLWSEAAFSGYRELERTVAERLDVPEVVVGLVAWAEFGRGLTDQRDRKARQLDPQAGPRRLQALRGHVTRDLLERIEPIVEWLDAGAATVAQVGIGASGQPSEGVTQSEIDLDEEVIRLVDVESEGQEVLSSDPEMHEDEVLDELVQRLAGAVRGIA